MRILFLLLLIPGPVLMQSCTSGKSETPSIPKPTEAIPVRVVHVSPTKDSRIVVASGQLTTENETIHAFKIGGIVKSINVREGDAVRKGQVLASLDLTEINAGVAQAELGAAKAARDLARLESLYRDSVVTLEQLQDSRTAWEVSEQQLAAAQFNRKYGVIVAIENGFVLKKFVNTGQVIGIGEPVVMTNAASANEWTLRIGVGSKQWTQLSGSEEARIKLDAFPGKTFKGTVLRKWERVDPENGLFTVELRVDPDGTRLATGMVGTAEIKTHHVEEFWNVPYEAVLDADGGNGFVFVTRDEKTALKKRVIIRSFDQQHIQVSGGLHDKEKLIVSGSAYLDDHSPISVIE